MPASGGAAAEWKRLSILLKLMDKAIVVWGSPNEMYGQQPADTSDWMRDTEELGNTEEREKEAKAKPFFFHPDMKFRTVWDLVQVVLLLYLLIGVPITIAFELDVKFASPQFWFDMCVDFYFVTDIIINFRTPFYDERNMLEIDERAIAMDYLKSWFVLDLITCFPISYIMLAINRDTDAASQGKNIRALRILRLLKLGKLLRMARLVRMADRYREQLRVFMKAFSGFVLAAAIFLLAHITGCLWYYIGTIDQDQDLDQLAPGYTGWVERHFGHAEPECNADHSAAAATSDDEVLCLTAGTGTRYIRSIYWALMTISTVGYGDITPHTDSEMIVTCVAMLFGALVFAAISGEMASRFVATKGAVQGFNTKMDEVRQYMHDKDVPIRERRRIEAHFGLLWGSKAIYDESEILSLMPREHRDKILETLYVGTMSNVALFSQLAHDEGEAKGREVLGRIALTLTHDVANFGLIIMQEGQYGDEMYMIEAGEVDIYRPTKHKSSTEVEEETQAKLDWRTGLGVRLGRLGSGAHFGERAVMSRGRKSAVRGRGVRQRTVVTRSTCHFYVLHKTSLDELRKHIPLLETIMLKVETGIGDELDDASVPLPSLVADAPPRGGHTRTGGGDATMRSLQAQVDALARGTDRKLEQILTKLASLEADAL